MKAEQFVMTCGAERNQLRALLPDGFTSLCPVLRINTDRNEYEKSRQKNSEF